MSWKFRDFFFRFQIERWTKTCRLRCLRGSGSEMRRFYFFFCEKSRFFDFRPKSKKRDFSKNQKSLEWPHFTSRTSETSHSTGFCPALNLKTKKKNSEIFNSKNPGFCIGEKSKKSKKKIFAHKKAQIWWVENVGTIFFPFSNWAPGKNLSNAMSQRFWKQNAAILSHFENLWFFQKWGGIRKGKGAFYWTRYCNGFFLSLAS